MLIPRFSIGRLFWLITASGIFCMAVALAIRGSYLARTLVAVVSLLAVSVLVFALTYGLATILNRVLPSQSPKTDSPFARHSLPPRYVAPENE